MPILFDPRVGSSLLGHFAGAIIGSSIARRTSFLLDALDTQVFARGITIVDDPHRRRGLGSKPFDGEGLPTARRELIADGVLTGWLLDSASARQLGLQPTGNAQRGIGGPPGAGTTNLYMAPGALSLAALMADIKRGLYVTELIGHGVNGVTGDYSRGAAGFLIEDGELGPAVAEITIAGNLKDMFRALTPADDLEVRTRDRRAHAAHRRHDGGRCLTRCSIGWRRPPPRRARWRLAARAPASGAGRRPAASPSARSISTSTGCSASGLATIDPLAGWLSEESVDDRSRLGRERVWVVDPIDGTRDYPARAAGLGGVGRAGRAGPAGAGACSMRRRGASAGRRSPGRGAWRNGVPIRVTPRETLPGARVPADQLPRGDSDLVAVTKPNSIALRIAMVAAGEADLVATLRWGREWDIAAAALIAWEAGARMTDALGGALAFNTESGEAFGVLATAPGIHAAAVERLARYTEIAERLAAR